MFIATWNINGIRSFNDGVNDIVDAVSSGVGGAKADIIALQETKLTRDQLDGSLANPEGYTAYYAFSRTKGGYSGVATLCSPRCLPTRAEEGLAGTLPSAKAADAVRCYGAIADEFSAQELKALDAEGRAVLTAHQTTADGNSQTLVIVNVYCPRADPDRPERQQLQLKFYRLLEMRCEALVKAGNRVVVVGDINTSHRPIDHCDPYEDFGKSPGRLWMDGFLVKREKGDEKDDEDDSGCHQFVDMFRHLHPDRQGAFTVWNTRLNCRENNYGTRLDYVLASRDLLPALASCDVFQEVMGSDHCPVAARFDLVPAAAERPPSHCAKNFPEFRQAKMSKFLVQPSGKRKESASEEKALPKKPREIKKQTQLGDFFKVKGQQNGAAGNKDADCDAIIPAIETDAAAAVAAAERREEAATAWKSLFRGPPAAPSCPGHGEKAMLRTVKKKGANAGRQFWSCARGEGKADDPNARCNFFQWYKK